MTAPLPRTDRPTDTPGHHHPSDAPRPRLRPGTRLAPPAIALAMGLVLGACTTGTPSETTTSTTSADPTPSATPSGQATSTPGTTSSGGSTPSSATPDAAPTPTPAAPEPGSTTVDVVVTFSGWNTATSTLEVGAYAATLVPGTCTLRLTGPAGATAEASASTVADASTVSCDGLTVPRGRLSTGSWSGVVEYTSDQGSGRAPVAPMDIP